MNKIQLIKLLSDVLEPECAHCIIGRENCPNPYERCLFKPAKNFVEEVAEQLLDRLR